jgi:deoxyribonuclease-4
MRLFGAHMSIAGGHALAIERATSFGMTACQIFTKNANQWAAKPIAVEGAAQFQERLAGSDVAFVVAHDSYLINLASPDEALWARSLAAFRDELERCNQLGVAWLVTHPGAHMGTGVEEGTARVALALNQLFAELPDLAVTVLLETTAGQGTTLGRTFEELAAILALVEDQRRVGVCFDTCHVFAAGYDLRDTVSYEATMQAFADVIGFDRLHVLHLNDSKKGLGSRVDRHANIGEGELGADAFRQLLHDERLSHVPGILETPKGDDGEDDRRNMATLHELASVGGDPASPAA